MLGKEYFEVKGAVYFPARAYNAYQTYDFFDRNEIERDFSYAESVGINALRIFTSYEQYRKDATCFFEKFDALLSIAKLHGIRILAILFENCGVPFSLESALSRNPNTAVCVQSPGHAVTKDPSKWADLFAYADAFMEKYRDDERLISIEVMNEPHEETEDVPFALALLKRCHAKKGVIPLSVGCMSLADNLWFGDYVDVFQYHDNFPKSLQAFASNLRQGKFLQDITGKPVWITEWQRLRLSGPGWNIKVIPEEERTPALHTLAKLVFDSGIGSFFWSLMVKPAYLSGQRPNGTYNGMFYEDGTVYSLEDYEVVAGNPHGAVSEKQTMPEWFLSDMKKNQ